MTREYYVNDYGAQVQTLARSVHLRYQELFGRTVTMPPKSYPGDYVKDVAGTLKDEFGGRYLDAPEAEWLGLFRDRAVEHVLGMIRGDLAAINIQFDRWSSEKALYESGTVERFLKVLEEKDLVYVGKLPPPKSRKGQPPPQPQSRRGRGRGVRRPDALPLVAVRGRGGPAGEEGRRHTHLLLRRHRLPLGQEAARADVLVDVLGADHGGYIPRLQAALEALGAPRDDLHVVVIQMVNLLAAARP